MKAMPPHQRTANTRRKMASRRLFRRSGPDGMAGAAARTFSIVVPVATPAMRRFFASLRREDRAMAAPTPTNRSGNSRATTVYESLRGTESTRDRVYRVYEGRTLGVYEGRTLGAESLCRERICRAFPENADFHTLNSCDDVLTVLPSVSFGDATKE